MDVEFGEVTSGALGAVGAVGAVGTLRTEESEGRVDGVEGGTGTTKPLESFGRLRNFGATPASPEMLRSSRRNNLGLESELKPEPELELGSTPGRF
jgi:hypothetical protein